MAAHANLTFSPSSSSLTSFHCSVHSSSAPLNSPFPGLSLKKTLPRKPLSLSLSASKKPLAVLYASQERDEVAEATVVDNQVSLSGLDIVIGAAFVDDEPEDDVGTVAVAAVPKKRTSKSKTRIRKNVWKRKAYFAALKAYSLAKSIATGRSKSFMIDKKD